VDIAPPGSPRPAAALLAALGARLAAWRAPRACCRSAGIGLLLGGSRLHVQLGALKNAQFTIDLHSDASAALAGDLAGPLAGAQQRSRDPAEVGILALRGESCCQARPPSLSSLGAGPPLSIRCHSFTNGRYRPSRLLSPALKRRAITSGGIECPPWRTRSCTRAIACSTDCSWRKTSFTTYPRLCHELIRWTYPFPASVVSNPKLIPAAAQRSISSSINRPARRAASSGANGDRPAAIRSALMKVVMPTSNGRYSRANVVLPAPLGPAMMMVRFSLLPRSATQPPDHRQNPIRHLLELRIDHLQGPRWGEHIEVAVEGDLIAHFRLLVVDPGVAHMR
jgi:hypothetical protein